MPINLPTYEQQQQAITLLQELGVDVDTLLAGRVVKSVQRGVTSAGGASAVTTVTISPVNTTKTLTVVSATPTTTNSPAITVRSNLASGTTLELFYTAASGNNPTISWQVIEFY